MPSPTDAPVADDYFNDLNQQLPPHQESSNSNNQSQPKSKRVACVLCRKRKLRCDGARPACGTCTRLTHDCAYDEVRKKSGPKRGYVKELEARLAQVETMLRTQDGLDMSFATSAEGIPDLGGIDPDQTQLLRAMHATNYPTSDAMLDVAAMRIPPFPRQDSASQMRSEDVDTSSPDPSMAWEPSPSLISLGMDEPLPAPEICAELTEAYFERCNHIVPIIHRGRFLLAMSHTSPNMRPPLCLQYAIWTLAASATPKFESLRDHLYRRARHYLQRDEMLGVGEKMLSMPTMQAWQCISAYEFKMMYFPRAWLSTGRTSRLAMMMGLHRLDGDTVDVKQCLPAPKDFIEKEERRRLFWMCFAGDRYASIGTGWPMSIDEGDIQTNLPSSEFAFANGISEPSISLTEALEPGGSEGLNPLGAVAVIACLFGRNLLHLHRKSPDDNDGDINGNFWKRHRHLDGIILSLLLGLPEPLRLPSSTNDPNVVFMNMCVHTSAICLHQAAIFKVEKHRLPPKLSSDSKLRCLSAAAEISSLMKMASHMDMSSTNPFMSFCLYVAARVFVQYLKSRPTDDTAKASLHFLLNALHAMKKTNPLAESFIAQLDVDLEAAGLDELRSLRVRAARTSQRRNGNGACPFTEEEPLHPESTQLPTRRPTYGDGGLAAHSDPVILTGRTQPKDLKMKLYSGKGDFTGILPTRPIMSTHTSPSTQASTDFEPMDFTCGSGTTTSPQTSTQNLSPNGFTPDSSTYNTNLEWTYVGSAQPSPPQPRPPVKTYQNLGIMPNVADFSANDFSSPEKVPQTSLLNLGAVDENLLFNMSEAEWGRMLGDLPELETQNGGWVLQDNGMV